MTGGAGTISSGKPLRIQFRHNAGGRQESQAKDGIRAGNAELPRLHAGFLRHATSGTLFQHVLSRVTRSIVSVRVHPLGGRSFDGQYLRHQQTPDIGNRGVTHRTLGLALGQIDRHD